MSFRALRSSDEKPVVPEEVENGVDVKCPKCGEIMRGRGPSKDGRARHFFHLADTDCPGGESDIHRKRKSLAVSALRVNVSDYRRCELEVGIDVSETRTGVDTRRADVLLEFEEEHSIFGRGIAVEVQYRNSHKNIPATTYDYLSQGYSVIWVDEEEFTDRSFRLDEIIVRFDNSENTYRPTSTEPDDLLPLDPPPLTGPEHYFDERLSGPESPTMRSADDCEHRWVEQREFCYECAECKARLHANPSIQIETEGESRQRFNENHGSQSGYVISLDVDVPFEALSQFRARGKIIEVRSESRDCSECGAEYEHVIGWDGLNLYSPGRLREQIKGKSYESLRKVNGKWVRSCPECGSPNQLRFTESADLYYCSSPIDTVWLPNESSGNRF
ncbi:hypothetical protein ACFQJ7_11565 [Halovenus rubra]|uniref:Uncharacterized protein n=2 Tax=Halovenus rubra TaxID=869890 RepID=A0ACC7E5E2_9EURY|nr:hypothetical protein [Halovenus rubra]